MILTDVLQVPTPPVGPGCGLGPRPAPGFLYFDRTRRRFSTVRPIRSAVGRPSSIYRVPPWLMARPRFWLPPKVWLQGSQSSMTGGRSARNGQT